MTDGDWSRFLAARPHLTYGAVPDLSTYLFEKALAARGPVDGEATD
ncbi:hypothetical protein [Micromonospora sp. WMMD736]